MRVAPTCTGAQLSRRVRVAENWGMRLLLVLVLVLFAWPAYAQCTKDIECKGDRVCTLGQCVEPGAVVVPVVPVAPVTPPAEAKKPRERSMAEMLKATELLRLTREVVELQERYDDAGMGAPTWKLVLAGVALAVSGIFWGVGLSPDFYGSSYGQTYVATAVVLDGAALLFGTIGIVQLVLRLNERATIPGQIEARQNRIAELNARQ